MATADVKESQEIGAGRDLAGQDSSVPNMTNGEGERTVEFNLSDPEQLMRQLESVDLTEEESDRLLNEAYKVNKRLREMLRQQEAREKAAQRSKSADSRTSYKTKHAVLPPISKANAGPSAKSRGVSHSHNSTTSAFPLKPGKPRNKSAKSKTTTQQKDRPVWDDRFSYS